MASASDSSMEMDDGDFPPTSVKHHDDVLDNLKRLREDEKFNDFKISLQDGDVFVNVAFMSKACDYFSSMVGDDKFLEGQTRELPMKEYGTKEAMELFAKYVYFGEMNFHEIDFSNLLEIMNISRMMMLRSNELFECIENYCKDILGYLGDYGGTETENLLRGLLLVSKYRLDNLRKSVVARNYFEAHVIDEFSERNIAILQQFSVELVKEVLLFQCDGDDGTRPTTGERFKYFLTWYSKNKDCGPEDKKRILESFKLSEFTGVELLTVVKESGFYSGEEIAKKCVEKFENLEKEQERIDEKLEKLRNCKGCKKCRKCIKYLRRNK